jgi:CheY-like chemotaxis protein
MSETAAARPFGVLIVDDDPAVLGVAAAFVAALGGAAFKAAGATEAVAALRQHAGEIDAALIDYQMPGALGPAVRQLLLVDRPGLPCCLMSGTLQPNDVPTGGFEAFLAKPFSPKQLRRALETMGFPPGP